MLKPLTLVTLKEVNVRFIFLSILVLATACSSNISVVSVTSRNATAQDITRLQDANGGLTGGGWKEFIVIVDRDDLAQALREESTVFINIRDCHNVDRNFPSVAFYLDYALDEDHRDALVALVEDNERVSIKGYAPTMFVNELSSVCVQLTGGSYLGRKTTSRVVRLDP